MSLNLDIDSLPPEQVEAAITRLEAVKAQRAAENKLAHFTPFPKQLEFFAAGAKYRERLLMSANQVGKSTAAAHEVAAHTSGLYPPWWPGYRFDRPVRAWVCGETGEVLREPMQRLLLGPEGQYGTGAIPKSALLDVVPARGLAELVDTIRVQHVSGGISTIALKSYAQGRERFQGATIDFAVLDEEPPADVFTEVLTRLNVSQGPLIMVFTPLRGMSTVVKRYVLEPSPDRIVVGMTLDDATFYNAETKARIVAQYPEHERDARIKGIPTMGSGRVFPVDEAKLLIDPFERPRHWLRLGGMDFGWHHYAAFVEVWHDRDLDVVYLVRTLRLREQTPHQHIDAVRHWNLTWAWPHDGRNQTLAGAGVPLMRQYADAGLDMMFDAASFPDKGNSVEAGVQMMLDRMRGDRWKVFKGQNDGWLEEFRMFHRDANGMLVKEGDDAISASRYAMMMLRNGRTDIPPKPRPSRWGRGASWMSA
jgi:phage terminase large subunit-like protein